MESSAAGAEKAIPKLPHSRLQKLAALLRFVVIGIFLMIIAALSVQFPAAVKGFGDCFRDASVFLPSPRFVFIVGNAIVIVLFAKSGQISAENPVRIACETSSFLDGLGEKRSEDVPMISKDEIYLRQVKHSRCDRGLTDTMSDNPLEIGNSGSNQRRRERSGGKRFVRSVTERRRSDCGEFGGMQLQLSYSEKDMSNEEFRRTVEAFIARQQRFLRGEVSP